jgi:F0F1-type ATP synthase assembly protein I
MAASLAVGSIIGIWLDHRCGTDPLFLVAGIGLGALAAGLQLRNMIRTLDRIDREQATPEDLGESKPGNQGPN